MLQRARRGSRQSEDGAELKPRSGLERRLLPYHHHDRSSTR